MPKFLELAAVASALSALAVWGSRRLPPERRKHFLVALVLVSWLIGMVLAASRDPTRLHDFEVDLRVAALVWTIPALGAAWVAARTTRLSLSLQLVLAFAGFVFLAFVALAIAFAFFVI